MPANVLQLFVEAAFLKNINFFKVLVVDLILCSNSKDVSKRLHSISI